ncbi:MAG: hypothetical protein SEPTF4163_004228 [Sporothrix epigloea]
MEHQGRDRVVHSVELDGQPRIASPVELSAASDVCAAPLNVISSAIGGNLTTTVSKRVSKKTISARQYSPSLLSPSSISLHPVVHRIPATRNLRLLAGKYKNIPSTAPPLTLFWGDRSRPSLKDKPIMVQVNVLQPMTVQSPKQRDFNLIPDSPPERSSESPTSSMSSSSGTISSSFISHGTSTTLISPVSTLNGPNIASFQDHLSSRQLLLEKKETGDGSKNSEDTCLLKGSISSDPSSKSLAQPHFVVRETLNTPSLPSSPSFSSSLTPSPEPTAQHNSSVLVAKPSQPSRLPRPRRIVPYNSSRGKALLKALRRLLILPPQWSAAQTLLFVLQHPNLRRLGLPRSRQSSSSSSSSSTTAPPKLSASYRDLLNVPRCSSLDWTGILQEADDSLLRYHQKNAVPLPTPTGAREPVSASTALSSHPFSALLGSSEPDSLPLSASDRKLISSWLASGEPLFTRQTSMASVLLRKGLGMQSRRQLARAWRASREAHVKALMESLAVRFYQGNVAATVDSQEKQYNIALNPRCRYHQLWTGAGASPLASSVNCL